MRYPQFETGLFFVLLRGTAEDDNRGHAICGKLANVSSEAGTKYLGQIVVYDREGRHRHKHEGRIFAQKPEGC
jgi:hypothetical protein